MKTAFFKSFIEGYNKTTFKGRALYEKKLLPYYHQEHGFAINASVNWRPDMIIGQNGNHPALKYLPHIKYIDIKVTGGPNYILQCHSNAGTSCDDWSTHGLDEETAIFYHWIEPERVVIIPLKWFIKNIDQYWSNLEPDYKPVHKYDHHIKRLSPCGSGTAYYLARKHNIESNLLLINDEEVPIYITGVPNEN